MYEDYRTPSEWRSYNSELVALDFWLDEKHSYEARVYWDTSQSKFYFEGKLRERRSRHIYFPKPNWAIIEVGSKADCIKFLDRTLPLYNCPSETLLELIGKIKRWKVADDTMINARVASTQKEPPDSRPPSVMPRILNQIKRWRDKCLGGR
jgi:hypothetical protein